MRSYLELIPMSARVNRRQSRMTRICIMLSVFLVAVIFSMADMEVRSQKIQAIQQDGAWHAGFFSISEKEARLIASRPEIAVMSPYAVTNYRLNQGFLVDGKETSICGYEESFSKLMPAAKIVDGTFPHKENEVVITESMKE